MKAHLVAALAVTMLLVNVGGALAGKCDAANDAKSINADVPASVTFRNATGVPVNVLWINYGGGGQFYKKLEPGEIYVQKTFVTHPWAFLETDNRTCIDVYFPTPGDQAFTIRR